MAGKSEIRLIRIGLVISWIRSNDVGVVTSPTRAIGGPPLRVPPLTSPFASRINPHAEAADLDTMAWLNRFSLVDDAELMARCESAKYGWMGARTYPYAPQNLLQLVTDWCAWLFVFDDAFCESGVSVGEIARAMPELYAVLDDGGPGHRFDNIYARALLDIKLRVVDHGNDDQLTRWRAATKDYLSAQVWEAGNREAGYVPPREDYVFMRRRTGAMMTVYTLVDVATQIPLSVEEWRHPAVTQLTEIANDVVVWDNDLISYAKEIVAGRNADNNLISVLRRHQRVSTQRAMDRLVQMRDRKLAEMVRLRPAIEELRSPGVSAYQAGLEYWISGMIEYSIGSTRYMNAWPAGTRFPNG